MGTHGISCLVGCSTLEWLAVSIRNHVGRSGAITIVYKHGMCLADNATTMPHAAYRMPHAADEPHKVLSCVAAVAVRTVVSWSVYCVRTFTQIFTVAKPVPAATWPSPSPSPWRQLS